MGSNVDGERLAVRRLVFAIPLLLALAACATSPTGRRQLMIVNPDALIADTRSAYTSMIGDWEDSGELLNDPALAGRVRVITGRLVTVAVARWPHVADWDWSVALVDKPDTINAWCMPGGRMALYSGIVYQLDLTDDELAQVMGHEISHAVANHSAERISRAMVQGIVVGALSQNTMSGFEADLLANLAVTLPNSRRAETEADEIGMQLAVAAGYDPDAGESVWRKMSESSDSPAFLQFLSTHPNPENRGERLAELADEVRHLAPSAPPVASPVRIHQD